MPNSPAEWLYAILVGCIGIIQILFWRIMGSYDARIKALEEYQRKDRENILEKLSCIEKQLANLSLSIEQRFMTKEECQRYHGLMAIQEQHSKPVDIQ